MVRREAPQSVNQASSASRVDRVVARHRDAEEPEAGSSQRVTGAFMIACVSCSVVMPAVLDPTQADVPCHQPCSTPDMEHGDADADERAATGAG